jgi:hypothetical protein
VASGRTGRVVSQINNSFGRFIADYLQAQGAYLSADASQGTLTVFTTQRVNLLGQELNRIFARLPGSSSKIQNRSQRASTNSAVVFQAFFRGGVNGTGTDANTGTQSLLHVLNSDAVVPPESPKKPIGAGATLYTLTATNAIQASREATINAAKFIASGTFNDH